jgi:translation initiation factor 5B
LEFQDRSQRIMVQLAEKGVNSKFYWDMKAEDVHDNYIALIPTSAISGEGVPDLLMNLISKTQDEQTDKMMYCENLQCTVLEGLGHTVDVVLVNGTLREGDTIVVSTLEGPVVTNIRALLTPPPNRELRY